MRRRQRGYADKGPGWAFTIGLWHTCGLPELAMFGLEQEGVR
jgi:hypothetical protein